MIVKQEEAMGCGVACLAMLLGEDYFTARKRFDREDFTTQGLTHVALDRRIAEAGFAIQRRYPKKGEAWPPEPFAAAHIARVKTSPGKQRVHHYVFVTNYGLVLDPEGYNRTSLKDYRRVLDVAGIFDTAGFSIFEAETQRAIRKLGQEVAR